MESLICQCQNFPRFSVAYVYMTSCDGWLCFFRNGAALSLELTVIFFRAVTVLRPVLHPWIFWIDSTESMDAIILFTVNSDWWDFFFWSPVPTQRGLIRVMENDAELCESGKCKCGTCKFWSSFFKSRVIYLRVYINHPDDNLTDPMATADWDGSSTVLQYLLKTVVVVIP